MTEPPDPESRSPDAPPGAVLEVLVVSDSAVVRAGLLSILASSTSPVMDAAGAADLPLQNAEAGDDHFDVAVVATDGQEGVVREEVLAAAEQAEGVVVLTDDPSGAASVLLAEAAGGWAVLSPDATGPELLSAVAAAAGGLVALSPENAGSLYSGERAPLPPDTGPLTPREIEVLGLVSEGLANKSIARSLGISDHTVKFHISSIYAKLDAANRAEAVSVAARLGLITL